MADAPMPDVQWRPGARRSGRTTRMVQAILADLRQRHRNDRVLFISPNGTIRTFVTQALQAQGATFDEVNRVHFVTTQENRIKGFRYCSVYFEHTVWEQDYEYGNRLSRDLRATLGDTVPFYGDIRPMLPPPQPPEPPRLTVWERLMGDDDD